MRAMFEFIKELFIGVLLFTSIPLLFMAMMIVYEWQQGG